MSHIRKVSTHGLALDDEPHQTLSARRGSAVSPEEQSRVRGGVLYKEVLGLLKTQGFVHSNRITQEIDWFFFSLGLNAYYFDNTHATTIAKHLTSIYGAKILAATEGKDPHDILVQQVTATDGFFVCNSRPGVSMAKGPQIEQQIDSLFLNGTVNGKPNLAGFSVQTYRSVATVGTESSNQLRLYHVRRSEFQSDGNDRNVDVSELGDKFFVQRTSQNTKQIYQEVLAEAAGRLGPVVRVYDVPERPHEKRIVVAYRRSAKSGFFSSMSDLYHYYKLFSTMKYIECFANGYAVLSLYLSAVTRPDESAEQLTHRFEDSIEKVAQEIPMLFLLPPGSHQLLQAGTLNVHETAYATAAGFFTYHFVARQGTGFQTLRNFLDASNPIHQMALANIKRRLAHNRFEVAQIEDTVARNPEIVGMLYKHFAFLHQPSSQLSEIESSKLRDATNLAEDIRRKIYKIGDEDDQQVFDVWLVFNQHVLKTNFYNPLAQALSFRLEASFLDIEEYPETPFGIFFLVGPEFRGFHVRFRDVARGGIRIIRSATAEAFARNSSSLFVENYNLANTQQRKNKDIPEGGSKGTILLRPEATQTIAQEAFKKYIDALLDVIIYPQPTEKMIDLYGAEEMLYLGPDEGTAEYMNWASQHARKRGARVWKAFTTGKSPSLGGIPHDEFGMTTMSVHTYVRGILNKLGLKEEDVTKFQTGGPDGDLGSNEIKISKDKTIAVVDGSGVAYDPNGLDRDELRRLADEREMVIKMDRSKPSPDGAVVLIDDRDISLPDGTQIDSGLHFRNTFHLNKLAAAELFVPCGGRPAAVDINNVHMLLSDGKPRFRYIVEGANLFFTAQARIQLENAGVVLIKDASANKGGVTSSSLEVLAALSMDDDEFNSLMCKTGDKAPKFYEDYVQEVLRIIENNAALEFECIWHEGELSGTARSVLSDKLSLKITTLQDRIAESDMYENETLRNTVLKRAIPKTLQEALGLEKILKNVPSQYLKATFSMYLASRFVYEHGLNPPEFGFFSFMQSFA